MSFKHSSRYENVVVPLVEDLFKTSLGDGAHIETRGYLTPGFGSEAYYYDANDNTTPINGGTVMPGIGGSLSFDAAGTIVITPV